MRSRPRSFEPRVSDRPRSCSAEGFALALKTINESAAAVGDNTMHLQYLDALKALGGSPSSKIVVPMELTGLVAGVAALAEVAKSTDGGTTTASI